MRSRRRRHEAPPARHKLWPPTQVRLAAQAAQQPQHGRRRRPPRPAGPRRSPSRPGAPPRAPLRRRPEAGRPAARRLAAPLPRARGRIPRTPGGPRGKRRPAPAACPATALPGRGRGTPPAARPRRLGLEDNAAGIVEAGAGPRRSRSAPARSFSRRSSCEAATIASVGVPIRSRLRRDARFPRPDERVRQVTESGPRTGIERPSQIDRVVRRAGRARRLARPRAPPASR